MRASVLITVSSVLGWSGLIMTLAYRCLREAREEGCLSCPARADCRAGNLGRQTRCSPSTGTRVEAWSPGWMLGAGAVGGGDGCGEEKLLASDWSTQGREGSHVILALQALWLPGVATATAALPDSEMRDSHASFGCVSDYWPCDSHTPIAND